MSANALISQLRSLRNEANIASQLRFGITPRTEQLGIPVPALRELAREHRRDHSLALDLWASDINEARILATFVADPARLTRDQSERWVRECDNWALTDAFAFLVDRTPFAATKALLWSTRQGEFMKRAAFSTMAGLAVHQKDLPDDVFLTFFPAITRESIDDRNFVKKSVNWALRQIGKRNPRLRKAAIAEAKAIAKIDSPAARWIAKDALRELKK
ncbi:MAG: DNA alkylation repair protein [Undibacterium sp.]|nr:DNA alkylation repair protein [Opitutaceae bacterium]